MLEQQKVCAFCHNTGKRGAQWVLYVGTQSHMVHRPCGEKLRETAPDGARVSLIPGKELAQQFRAQNFWKKNFRGKVQEPAKEPVARST